MPLEKVSAAFVPKILSSSVFVTLNSDANGIGVFGAKEEALEETGPTLVIV